VQAPVQHSASRAHTSPLCVQKELAKRHAPSEHRPEQHSDPALQALPEVLHARLSATQEPPSQRPPQHSSAEAHAAPSDAQEVDEHAPAWQLRVVHCVPVWQGVPEGWLATGTVAVTCPLPPCPSTGSPPTSPELGKSSPGGNSVLPGAPELPPMVVVSCCGLLPHAMLSATRLERARARRIGLCMVLIVLGAGT